MRPSVTDRHGSVQRSGTSPSGGIINAYVLLINRELNVVSHVIDVCARCDVQNAR